MKNRPERARIRSLQLAAVLTAGSILAGCSTLGLADGNGSQSSADAAEAVAHGGTTQAVLAAEAAVLNAPNEPAARALLGRAYLKAGRLISARDALNDAVTLGDAEASTIAMLALAQIAAGQPRTAIATIERQGMAIPAAERGLVLALAGETARGVQIIADAIRAGDSTARARQNLAYAFALDGRWREARVMAAQDVPADQLDRRITAWAMAGRPEQAAERIAGLLNTQLAPADAGQPIQLALANYPEIAPPVAAPPAPYAAIAHVDTRNDDAELPPLGIQSTVAPVATAAVAPSALSAAPAPVSTVRPAAQPVVKLQTAPTPAPFPARAAAARAARPAAPDLPRAGSGGTHVAQLGSFGSMEQAKAGWAVFQSRYANLRGVTPVIGKAQVEGRTYYRVAAAGFDANQASAMCRVVKAGGHGCLPITRDRLGTRVDVAVRMAKAD